jgi:PadR family transcriptional regulator PadR
VPVQDTTWLAGAIRSNGNRDVTVRVLPNTNHIFVPDGDGDPRRYLRLPALRVPPTTLGLIADCLAAHLDADRCPAPLTRVREVRRDGLALNRYVLQSSSMSSPSLGTLELAALLAVARLADDAYGLAVRRDLVERMARDYSVGAIYTTLQRLEDKGLLTSCPSAPLPVRGGRSRRRYLLTSAGTRAMRDAARHTASMWAGISARPEPA